MHNGAVTGPLISVPELRDLMATPQAVTLLDVRYRLGSATGREEHAQAHLPGAAYVDLDADLAAPAGEGGRHPLPAAARFEEAMRGAGVCRDRPVVVYDDWAAHAAGRAWWLLRFHGHRDVRVLDGGLAAWLEEDGRVETGAVRPEPGDFACSGQIGMPVVEAAAVLDVDVLIDARAGERYRGEAEPIDLVAGHIPGAVNVPTSRNLTARGRFRSAEELRATYADVGAVAGADVATYCGSGVTAAHDILALEIAGVRAALYPGSWSGWIADPHRPVATG